MIPGDWIILFLWGHSFYSLIRLVSRGVLYHGSLTVGSVLGGLRSLLLLLHGWRRSMSRLLSVIARTNSWLYNEIRQGFRLYLSLVIACVQAHNLCLSRSLTSDEMWLLVLWIVTTLGLL